MGKPLHDVCVSARCQAAALPNRRRKRHRPCYLRGPGQAVRPIRPAIMRGAERRQTRRCARPPERLAQPPDTLAKRVLSACDRGEAPPGAPLAAIYVPGAVASGRVRGPPGLPSAGRLSPAFAPAASSHSRQIPVVGPDGYPGPPEGGVTSPARRRRVPLRPRCVSGRRPSMSGIKGLIA